MDWKLGVAAVQMLDRKLNVSLDYTAPKNDDGYVSGGFEYWLVPFIALRAGYVNSKNGRQRRARQRIGLQASKAFRFDYAYAGQGELRA